MKKKIKWVIASLACLSVIISIVTLHYVYGEKITISSENVHAVRLIYYDVESVKTEDKEEIEIIIDFFNSMTFYCRGDPVIGESAPSAIMSTYDENGEIIESITFYHTVVIHKSSGYTAGPFAYSRIALLLSKLNAVELR